MATDIYPPLGFFFSVEIDGIKEKSNDTKFQSVTGLSVDVELEEIAEGGENRYKHKFPVKTKYPNLVLKRGMLVDSEIIDWFKDGIESFDIQPKDLVVKLMHDSVKDRSVKNDKDSKIEPLYVWSIKGAYPIKWNVDAFNAEESKVVVETVELAYNYFTAGKAQNS
ncbi:MAG: phage tail protein [bacterium]|nr:phage tail protein [bacterium]